MQVEEQRTTNANTEVEVAGVRLTRRRSWVGVAIVLLVVASILGYVIVSGLTSRARAASELKQNTEQMAIPTVSVIHPGSSGEGDEVVLPGNMEAFMDTPIWARSSGYLTHWYADIGTHVTKGQLLAEIQAPEIDRQLQQARADLETAQANYGLSVSTAKRYQDLLKSDSVSRQETDEKVSDLAAKKTVVDANVQNVHRLEEIQSFQKVYAPFDGVITARNIDVGALIDAGANSPGKELFHEASTNTLRVFVNVPQIDSQAAKPGVIADLTLPEYPSRTFHGVLARTADSIEMSSRTLRTEVDVRNATGELLPGSYVSVHLKLPSKKRAMTIPVNALLFRSEGTQVAIVRNDRTELVPVKIGRDFGNEVELLSGVSPADAVIVNPSDSIGSGLSVHVAATKHGGEGQ